MEGALDPGAGWGRATAPGATLGMAASLLLGPLVAVGVSSSPDAVCREHGISADAARAGLADGLEPWLEVPGCDGRVNGWEFLRGSPSPRPWTADAARRVLSP